MHTASCLGIFLLCLVAACTAGRESSPRDLAPPPSLPNGQASSGDSELSDLTPDVEDGTTANSMDAFDALETTPRLSLGQGITCSWTDSQSRCWGVGADEHAKHIIGADQLVVDGVVACALRSGVLDCWSTDLTKALPPNMPLFDEITSFSYQARETEPFEGHLAVLRKNGAFVLSQNGYAPLEGLLVGVEDYLWTLDGRNYCGVSLDGLMLSCSPQEIPQSIHKFLRVADIYRDETSSQVCVRLYESKELLCGQDFLDFDDHSRDPVDIPPYVQLAVGASIACAVLEDGRVGCWNIAYSGWRPFSSEDGVFTIVPELEGAVRVAVGADHLCAVLRDGRILCLGNNDEGQLGYAEDFERFLQPQTVAGLTEVVTLAMDGDAACARQEDGSIECWGYEYWDENYHPTKLMDGAEDLHFNGSWVCARRADTSLWCAELGKEGAIMIEAGVASFGLMRSGGGYALSADKKFWCVGTDYGGEDCDGWTEYDAEKWNTAWYEHAPPAPKGGDKVLDDLIVGALTPCVLTKAKHLYCCDDHYSGNCQRWPYEKVVNLYSGFRDSGEFLCVTTTENGALWCRGSIVFPRDREVWDNLKLKSKIAEVAIDAYVCVRFANGRVSCDNGDLKFKRVSGITDATKIAVSTGSTFYACALHETGRVSCWGQLAEHLPVQETPKEVPGLENVLQIGLGGSSACALTEDGEVLCWGYLGYASTGFMGTKKPVELPWRDFFEEGKATP